MPTKTTQISIKFNRWLYIKILIPGVFSMISPVLEYLLCCAAARCVLPAASNENLCEAKLIERGKFEANLMSHLMWGDVVFNSVKNSILLYSAQNWHTIFRYKI